MTTLTLTRKFRFGATTLLDPAPGLPPAEALRIHAGTHAFLETASLGEPTIEGDSLVYPILRPTVTTKG